MTIFTQSAPEMSNLADIQQELKTYFYKQIRLLDEGAMVVNDQMVINAMLTTPLNVILYEGVRYDEMEYECPNFASYLAPLVELYGEPKYHNFWAGLPHSVTPAKCYSEIPVKLWIPINSPVGSHVDCYDYSGERELKQISNNGYHIIPAFFPKSPKDLVLVDKKHITSPTWFKADEFISLSNWSNELTLYSSISFSDQNKLATLFE